MARTRMAQWMSADPRDSNLTTLHYFCTSAHAVIGRSLSPQARYA